MLFPRIVERARNVNQRSPRRNAMSFRYIPASSTMFLFALLALALFMVPLPAAGQKGDKVESEKLHKIMKDYWEWYLKENPVFASELGDLRYNTKWPDLSNANIEKK